VAVNPARPDEQAFLPSGSVEHAFVAVHPFFGRLLTDEKEGGSKRPAGKAERSWTRAERHRAGTVLGVKATDNVS
jgi:hypothetical protein